MAERDKDLLAERKTAFEESLNGLAELFVQVRANQEGVEDLLVSKGILTRAEIDTAHNAGRRKMEAAAAAGKSWTALLLASDPTPGKSQ